MAVLNPGTRPLFKMPFRALMLMLCVYVFVQAAPMLATWLFHDQVPISKFLILLAYPQLKIMRIMILIFASLLYGLLRVGRTHPSLMGRYSNWLTMSAWRSSLPLPMGPVALVWEDVAFAAAVTALAWMDLPNLTLRPISLGIVPYSIGVLGPALSAGKDARLACYGIVMLLFAMLLAATSQTLTLVLLVLLVLMQRVVISRSLVRLPFEAPREEHAEKQRAPRRADVWLMAPRELPAPIEPFDGWMITLLLAWITFCISSKCPDFTEAQQAWGLVLVIAVSVSCGRLLAYAMNFAAPVGVLGRLTSGQWIIPAYDKIWLVPILSFAACVLTFVFAIQSRLSPPLATALAVAAVFAVVLNAGPTRRNWQLTGHHRIIFRPEQNQSRQRRHLQGTA